MQSAKRSCTACYWGGWSGSLQEVRENIFPLCLCLSPDGLRISLNPCQLYYPASMTLTSSTTFFLHLTADQFLKMPFYFSPLPPLQTNRHAVVPAYSFLWHYSGIVKCHNSWRPPFFSKTEPFHLHFKKPYFPGSLLCNSLQSIPGLLSNLLGISRCSVLTSGLAGPFDTWACDPWCHPLEIIAVTWWCHCITSGLQHTQSSCV